jgi:hypothetical protein
MSDGRRLTISERATAAREARHNARRAENPPPSQSRASRDPWYSAGPQGTWGRGDSQEQREAAPDLLDRAREALSFGSNRRFEMLARRVDQLFRW